MDTTHIYLLFSCYVKLTQWNKNNLLKFWQKTQWFDVNQTNYHHGITYAITYNNKHWTLCLWTEPSTPQYFNCFECLIVHLINQISLLNRISTTCLMLIMVTRSQQCYWLILQTQEKRMIACQLQIGFYIQIIFGKSVVTLRLFP